MSSKRTSYVLLPNPCAAQQLEAGLCLRPGEFAFSGQRRNGRHLRAPLLLSTTASRSFCSITSRTPKQPHEHAGTECSESCDECEGLRNKRNHNTRRVARKDETEVGDNVVCLEVTRGRQRVYRSREVTQGCCTWDAFDMVDDRVPHLKRLQRIVQSYLLPQGFPDSVAPQYAPYMMWRGVQYAFGGAISVFTTKSLLSALGVAGRHSGSTAAAINWVLKDGAGRLGRFLFARWGRQLDDGLKQFRLLGDVLMEAGALMELSTIAAPHAFLPLACTANLAKNLAAVAASSTRAPIYRTFALQNNLADVTAKGESVSNLADIVGTIIGIALSKKQTALVPTFMVLSAGYLYASRREIDAVELPYFNTARLSYAVRRFLTTGVVPDCSEANQKESLLPWGGNGTARLVVGASVETACQGPADLQQALEAWKEEPYLITHRRDKRRVYVMLRDGATSSDVLHGSFTALVFQHLLDAFERNPLVHPLSHLPSTALARGSHHRQHARLQAAWTAMTPQQQQSMLTSIARTHSTALFASFRDQSQRHGWRLQATMIHPQDSRIVQLQQPLQ